jgi:pullulanase/glycogen debranching enzyme
MIHSGQEFARSKVIPLTNENDPHRGMLDHNSYDKDNEVNYINYNHASMNQELLDYYKGLIELRSEFKSFRRAEYDEVKFISVKDNDFAFGYEVKHENENFVVLFNAHPLKEGSFELPKGKWEVLVDKDKAGTKLIEVVSGKIAVPTSSGYVLKKK